VLAIASPKTPEQFGVSLLDFMDSMYEEVISEKVNKRRYLWLIYYLIKARLNFSVFEEVGDQ